MNPVPDLVALAFGFGLYVALLGLVRLCRYLEARQ